MVCGTIRSKMAWEFVKSGIDGNMWGKLAKLDAAEWSDF